jgi:hypothetical protein
MNITLSADQNLIEKSRQYAKKHNTTLNNLIREYLERIIGKQDREELAKEFEKLAAEMGGKSSPGFHFNREEIYSRVIDT